MAFLKKIFKLGLLVFILGFFWHTHLASAFSGTQLSGSIGTHCDPLCIESASFDTLANGQYIYVTNNPYDPGWGAFQIRTDSLSNFVWNWSWAHDPGGLGNFMVSIP